MAEPKKTTKKPRKKNYLNNKDLLAETVKSLEQGRMTDTLARMLQTLCARLGTKGNFVNYSYNEDMQGYAMLMLAKTWKSFKPEKSNNPFAFYTQCIKHSFIQYLNQEKRQRNIRDALLVDQGLNPSLTYQMENAGSSDDSSEGQSGEAYSVNAEDYNNNSED